MYTQQEHQWQYRSVPSKHPWALGNSRVKNQGGWHLHVHGESICTYNVYTWTVGSSKMGGGRLQGEFICTYNVHTHEP